MKDSKSSKKNECDICKKQFCQSSTLKRHQEKAHPAFFYSRLQEQQALNEKKKKKCPICSRFFSRQADVSRHQKTIHGLNASLNAQESPNLSTPAIRNRTAQHKCIVCDKRFTRAGHLRTHMTNIHHIQPQTTERHKCFECLSYFSTKSSFMKHVSNQHQDITIKTETLSFESQEEFDQWKIEIEKSTASSYVLHNQYKTSAASVCSYVCHRSGCFKSKSEGIRHLKIGGSNKIDSFCPASIRSKTYGECRVDVTFCSTHMGHDCEVNRLRLSKREKREIVGLLPVGACLKNKPMAASPEESDLLAEDGTLSLDSCQDTRNGEETAVAYQLLTNTIEDKQQEVCSYILEFIPLLNNCTGAILW